MNLLGDYEFCFVKYILNVKAMLQLASIIKRKGKASLGYDGMCYKKMP